MHCALILFFAAFSVDLVRLMACAGDLAMVFANVWRDLPLVAADFSRWAAASGLALSVAKFILVRAVRLCARRVRCL